MLTSLDDDKGSGGRGDEIRFRPNWRKSRSSVLFELISARYERRSIMITANQPFGEWNRFFPDPAMTL